MDVGSDHLRERAERLAILRLDYEMAREDERSFQSIQAALIGVAVTLIAGLSAILTRGGVLGEGAGDGGDIAYAPEPVLVLTPMVPFALVTFAILLGAISTVRSYYLRALEAELQEYGGGPLKSLGPIRPGSYMELMSGLVSVKRGVRWYPYLALVIVIAALCIFGGFIVYIYSGVEGSVGRLAMLLLYGPATIFLLIQTGQATVGGRGLFADVAAAYIERLRGDRPSSVPLTHLPPRRLESAKRERSLTSYLILPRPDELPKALFLPLVYLVASFALDGISAESAFRACVVWIALEYLIYGARYQWNDARGLHEDYAYNKRGRLPLGDDPPKSTLTNLHISSAVGILRLVLALGLALVAGHRTLGPVAVLLVAVFAVAAPYEWLRARTTDGSLSPARRDLLSRAIWLVVGGGYAIRGVAGLYLAGFALGDPLLIVGAVAFAGYGIMFVTLTWALEALANSAPGEDGKLRFRPDIPPKPHLEMLMGYMNVPEPPYRDCPDCVRESGERGDCDHLGGEGDDDPVHARGLLSRGVGLAPWDLALGLCAASGGALGVGIATGGTLDGWALVGGALGLVGALMLAHVPAPWRLAVTGVVGLLFAGLGVAASGDGFLLAVLPWLLFAGLYSSFRDSSYYSMMHWLDELLIAVAGAATSLLEAAVGRRTVAELRAEAGGDGGP